MSKKKISRPGPTSAKAAGPVGPLSPKTGARRGSVPRAGVGVGPGRQGKYNAKGEHVDGRFFASAAEAERYRQLKALLEEGRIENLECQPVFQCSVNNVHICTYRADFRYVALDERGSLVGVVIEDVKGMVTDVYAIKKKLVEACFRVKITEIPARKIKDWAGKPAG